MNGGGFVRFVVDRPHPTVDAELGMFTRNP